MPLAGCSFSQPSSDSPKIRRRQFSSRVLSLRISVSKVKKEVGENCIVTSFRKIYSTARTIMVLKSVRMRREMEKLKARHHLNDFNCSQNVIEN